MSSLPSKFFVLHRRARLPGGLHVLGPEADLLLAAPDAVVDLRLHRVEGLLQLLLRDGPRVLLERLVAQIDEAVAEDQLPVVAAAGVGLDGEVRQAGGGVEGDELVRRVELHAAVVQRHQLALPAADRVVLSGQVEPRHARGGLVDDGQLAEAARGSEPRDLGALDGEHRRAGSQRTSFASTRKLLTTSMPTGAGRNPPSSRSERPP